LPGFGDVRIGQNDSNISKAVLQQPLYTFGRIESGVKMIEEQVKAEECALSAKKEDIVLAVVKSYLEVLKAQNRAGIAHEGHRVISEHLQLTETLFKAGVVLSTDVAATRVKQLEAEQKLVEEENAVHIAEEELSHLLGLPTGELGTIADIPLGSLSLPPASTTTLALRHPSSEIQRVDALLRLLRNRHFIEKRGQYPIVSLQATYETGNQFTEHQKNWNAVVVLDFPIFDSGATKARASQVHHEIARTTHQRSLVEQGVELAVKTSFLRVQELEKKIGLAMQALQTAQENLDQNRINYREGAALNTDVLNAELLLRNAKVAYSNAFFDYLYQQTALHKHLGRLSEYLRTVLGVDATF
ncbi:MAG TPA: TolC family protein, partial [Candidatus Ozemobacteraceae bacterium]|nr:TolC family protein [Candidatus Ozemobacteraceae bacterium]